MKVPSAQNATIPERKITGYLLALAHDEGGPKARFFIAHGYTLADWQRLADDLLAHGRRYDVIGTRRTVGGTNYEVTGALTMPDDRTYTVVTVWHVPDETGVPRLITARPAR